LKLVSRLDILLNNAGIVAVLAGMTKDSYEIQFGTNHLGHALLMLAKTAQVLDADVRAVTLSSAALSRTPTGGIKFDVLKTAVEEDNRVSKYGQSKLANVLHSNGIARRYPTITAVAVHPGTVDTGLSKPIRDSHR